MCAMCAPAARFTVRGVRASFIGNLLDRSKYGGSEAKDFEVSRAKAAKSQCGQIAAAGSLPAVWYGGSNTRGLSQLWLLSGADGRRD